MKLLKTLIFVLILLSKEALQASKEWFRVRNYALDILEGLKGVIGPDEKYWSSLYE